MRILAIILALPAVLGFGVPRREAIKQSGVAFVVGIVAPELANAFSQQLDENIVEPSQQPTGGKVDLNAAFVGEYMQFPGMFPNAAGKIASNGPYKSVSDIYKIQGLTDNDKKMFKKYEREFTVNPPGRAFNERINARVST